MERVQLAIIFDYRLIKCIHHLAYNMSNNSVKCPLNFSRAQDAKVQNLNITGLLQYGREKHQFLTIVKLQPANVRFFLDK